MINERKIVKKGERKIIPDFFTSSIRRKISSGFTIVILLVLFMLLISYFQLKKVRSSAEQIIPNSMQMNLSQDIALDILSMDSNIERFFIIGGVQIQEDIFHDLENMTEHLESMKKQYNERAMPIIKELENITAGLKKDILGVIETETTKPTSREMNEIIISIYSKIKDATRLHRELNTEILTQLNDTVKEQESITNNMIYQFVILGILVFLLAISASLLLAKIISKPIVELRDASNKVGEGKLDTQIQIESNDEIGQLAFSFNRMVENIRQSGKELQESEEKYRTLVEKMEEGIGIVDDKENFVFVNQTAANMFGYPKEQLLGKNLKELTTPEGFQRVLKQTSIRKIGKSSKFELSIIRKDGEKRTILITASSKIDNNGRYQGTLGIFHDITIQKQAEGELKKKTAQLISSQEEAQKLYKDSEKSRNTLSSILEDVVEKDSKLQLSQKRFQDIVNNTGDWIWETDKEGCYTYCSPVVKQVLGYEDKEVIGKYFYDFFVPEKKEEMKKAALKAFTQKKPFKNFININIHKDGHEVILETSGIPLLDGEGDWKGYRGVDRDISERVQQELIRETKIQLLDKLRGVKTIEDCLKLGCEVIQKAGLFKRAVLTLHNNEGEITHLGQAGLKLKLVEQARQASTPDMNLKKRIESKEFKVSHSYFVPEEAGLNYEQTGRYAPQDKQSNIKTKNFWQPRDELFVPVISKEGIIEGYLSVDTPFNGKRPDKRTILNIEDIVDIVTRQVHEIQNMEILRESETKYRLLAENTLDCVWKMDKDLKFIYINQSILPILGFTREEWTESTLTEHCSEKELQRFKNIVEDELRKEDTYSAIFELNLFHKDGREIPLEILGKILLDENKKVIGFQGNARDITERKQAEKIQRALYDISNALDTVENLHELFIKIREYLGNIIDTTNFYVALYDEKTDMISLPFDVDEKDDFEIFPAGKTLTAFVIKTGKPLFANKQLQDELNKQGKIDIIGTRSEIWLGVPLKIENKVIGVIAVQSYDDPHLYSEKDIEILTFISEEIALAIEHKQADEQIKRELKEKELLLSEIHHRVKNNLQVISGLLMLQENEIITKEDALKGFAASQDRILAMAKAYELLLGSQYMSEVIVGKYIESLAEQLKHNYDIHEKVKISYSLDEFAISIEILDRLGLILNEIITNSIKHAFEGRDSGNIHIELKEIEKYIVIKISDDGIGMSEDIDMKTPETLGLSLVEMLMLQLRGTLSLDRENGTSFTLEIPKELNEN